MRWCVLAAILTGCADGGWQPVPGQTPEDAEPLQNMACRGTSDGVEFRSDKTWPAIPANGSATLYISGAVDGDDGTSGILDCGVDETGEASTRIFDRNTYELLFEEDTYGDAAEGVVFIQLFEGPTGGLSVQVAEYTGEVLTVDFGMQIADEAFEEVYRGGLFVESQDVLDNCSLSKL